MKGCYIMLNHCENVTYRSYPLDRTSSAPDQWQGTYSPKQSPSVERSKPFAVPPNGPPHKRERKDSPEVEPIESK